MLAYIFGVIGLFIGSFLNVVILRLDSEEKFWQGRSHCMKCGTTLQWYDLVPLFSFLLLRGKCRYCGTSLSWQYPLIEGVSGLLFAITAYYFFPNLQYIFLATWQEVFLFGIILLLVAQLIIVFVYDLKHMLIPVVSLRIIQLAGLFWVGIAWYQQGSIPSNVWTASILASIIFALYVGTKKQGMGFGDVELIFGLGLFLPIPSTFLMFFLSFFIGSVWGVVVAVTQKSTSLKVKIPFGPSIILAFLFVFFFAETLPFLQIFYSMIY